MRGVTGSTEMPNARSDKLASWPGARGSKVSKPRCSLSKLRVNCSSERSEEHTSELQSLMRISYAVFCLKKKKNNRNKHKINNNNNNQLSHNLQNICSRQ